MDLSLSAEALSLAYDERPVVEGLSHAIAPGKITALVGPNGSGKSTALKGLARILSPRAGVVRLNGEPLSALSTREVAKKLAILPQVPRAPEGLTVRELVRFGRYPYRRPFRGLSQADEQAVSRALAQVELTELAHRPVFSLSGGQAQRVWIALTLAQETGILLLDEPTTYLDVAHQLEVLRLLRRLNHDTQLTVVMAMHDLNLAARYSDWMVALKGGRLIAEGAPPHFMTAHTLEEVFSVKATLLPVPGSDVPVFLPGDPT